MARRPRALGTKCLTQLAGSPDHWAQVFDSTGTAAQITGRRVFDPTGTAATGRQVFGSIGAAACMAPNF